MPRAGQVDVEHVLPGLLCHVDHRSEGHDAGIGNDDIEAPKVVCRLIDRGLERLIIAHIDGMRRDATNERPDGVCGLLKIDDRAELRHGRDALADVDRDDIGTRLSESYRMTAALATCCAGYQRNLPFDPTDLCSSP
jgi:hypothetical protein